MGRGREGKMNRLHALRNLDVGKLFEVLDPALNELSLGCIIPEPVDEGLCLFDLFLSCPILTEEGCKFLLPHLLIL